MPTVREIFRKNLFAQSVYPIHVIYFIQRSVLVITVVT